MHKFLRRLAATCFAAASLVPAASPAGCRYVKLGTAALEWHEGLPYVEGSVDGKSVPMRIATGTEYVTLTSGLADRLGLELLPATEQRQVVTTFWTLSAAAGSWIGADGARAAALVHASELAIGQIHFAHPYVTVRTATPLPVAFVGASLLFQHDFEIDGSQARWFDPSGCDDAPLAYWGGADVPFVALEAESPTDHVAITTVRIDGKSMRALVDTGRARSSLDLGLARQLGFVPPAPASASASDAPTRWEAMFDTFELGDETIRQPRLVVEDLWTTARRHAGSRGVWNAVVEQPRMILGADFLRAHRLLFAQSQHRLYFSYLGGPVFGPPAGAGAAASAAASAAPVSASAP